MILRWWRRRREQRQAGERWERRWGALARYNAERARGIVHSAGYQAHMADEKAAYDAEQGYEFWEDQGDGIVGRGPHGWISR